jgi:hypothetical protein
MTPYLITPPDSLPVSAYDLREHLRLPGEYLEADVMAKQSEAVAVLDAWTGLLGRCIMPQTWAVDVEGEGPHLLPFPDVLLITAVSGDDPAPVSFKRSALGHLVTLNGVLPGQPATIRFQCGMSDQLRPAAQSLIKLMVSRDFDMLSGPDYDANERTIRMAIGALRWRHS